MKRPKSEVVVLYGTDRLGKCVLHALGIPLPERDLRDLGTSVSVTQQEFDLLSGCTGIHNPSRSFGIVGVNSNTTHMLACLTDHRPWNTFGLFSQMKCNRRLLDLMVCVAVEYGTELLVKKLLDMWFVNDLSFEDKIPEKLLETACKNGSLSLCNLMLDTFKYTPNVLTNVLKAVIEQIPRDSQRLTVDAVTSLGLLLTRGADPNASHGNERHTHGYLLQRAIYQESLSAMKVLLSHGAILAQSGALQAAVAIDFVEALDLLFEHGADVNELLIERVRSTDTRQILSSGRESALNYAVRCGSEKATQWLLEHGADPKLFVETSGMRLDKDGEKMELAEKIWGKRREQKAKRIRIKISKKKKKKVTLFDFWGDASITKPALLYGKAFSS